MPRWIMLSVLPIALTATPACAADLPAQSQIGKIFSDQPVRTRRDAAPPQGYSAPIIGYNVLPSPPWARGGYYYGSPFSYFDSGPYYGGSYVSPIVRLPYVCGFYGYCP
jgi:hypothetical protein